MSNQLAHPGNQLAGFYGQQSAKLNNNLDGDADTASQEGLGALIAIIGSEALELRQRASEIAQMICGHNDQQRPSEKEIQPPQNAIEHLSLNVRLLSEALSHLSRLQGRL